MTLSGLLIFAAAYVVATASPGPGVAAVVAAAARARRLFTSPRAIQSLNRGTGVVMAGAAVAVATR